METYGYSFLLSVTGYLGIQVVLTLVRTTGATTAVTVTTTRKAMSIAVSFIFFTKPFTWQYVWSGLIIVLGIFLNVYSKRSKLTFTEFIGKLRRLIHRRKDDESRQKLLELLHLNLILFHVKLFFGIEPASEGNSLQFHFFFSYYF